jgi:hypothetical protein
MNRLALPPNTISIFAVPTADDPLSPSLHALPGRGATPSRSFKGCTAIRWHSPLPKRQKSSRCNCFGLAYLKPHHEHYTLNSSEPNAIPANQEPFVNEVGAMAFVRITAIFALFTFPFALAHTVRPAPPDKILYLCLQLGLPHLFVAFSPKATRNASIGIALGSSLLLFLGISLITLFGWFLGTAVFESVPGERDAVMWPWILASAAHGAMFAAAIFADRANKLRISVPMYGFIGFAYSALSILLAAR